VWDPNPAITPFSPFEEPIPDPGTDPLSAPLVCVAFNESWRPIVAGALLATLPPTAWDVSDPAALLDVEERAEQLLHAVGVAERCIMQTVSVTIPVGEASGASVITFAVPFTTAPVVIVSCDNAALIASWESVTTDGFTARLTANVVQPADVTATISYLVGIFS
jgi:hypothetical protein